MRTALVIVGVLLAGCAARQGDSKIGAAWGEPDAQGPEGPEPPEAEQEPAGDPPLPDDVVARAALPFGGLQVKDGTPLSSKQLLDRLAEADAVCVAEQHDNPHDHYAQVAVLRGLLRRARNNGRELALGMEMFQVPFQKVLDRFVARKLDEDELLEQTEYDERWGFDFALYRPLVRIARRRGLPLLALNAPKELASEVAKKGLRNLTEAEAKQLPDLDFSDRAHREWFEKQMAHHPHPAPPHETAGKDPDAAESSPTQPEGDPHAEGGHHGKPIGKGHGKKFLRRMYAAQLVWDETMAQTASEWLRERQPARQLVIVAGGGHCQRRAIPDRMRRRQAGKVVNVLPYVAREGDAAPEDLQSFDYAFVMTPEE